MKEKDFEGRHREEKYHLKGQQKDWQLTSQQKSRKEWYKILIYLKKILSNL